MKQKIYRFDSSFDEPGKYGYAATLTPSNLEGMKLLKNITPQNFRGTSLKLVGYDKLGPANRAKATEVLRILVGGRFDKLEYRGGTREFHLYFKANKDEVLGKYIDRIFCVTTKLLPKVESLPSYDDSETGRERGYVIYSETVPNWGDRIGYKLPFSQAAYNARLAAENKADIERSKTRLEVETNENKAAEQDAQEQQYKASAEQAKNQQTIFKTIRWVCLGIVAAVVVGVVIFVIVKSKK